MDCRTTWRGLSLGFGIAVCSGGCWPGSEVYKASLDAMRAEIEALAADKTASDDSDCGFTRYVESEGTCRTVDVVYSRATVDEDLLLEKVQEYNQLVASVNRLSGYDYLLSPVCTAAPQPAEVKVVSGVCVASY